MVVLESALAAVPSGDRLEVAEGLREAHGWDEERIEGYFAARALRDQPIV